MPTLPGPAALGRGVVVAAGTPPPAPWTDAPVVVVDERALSDSEPVDRLHEAWARRTPIVVVLAIDPARFRSAGTWHGDVFTLRPDFEPGWDRLHFLVWANNYDARTDTPVWWWSRKAAALGAAETGPADVVLADGTPAWVDGGPRGPLDGAALGAAVVHRETVELGRLTVAPIAPPLAADLAPDQLAAVAHGSGPARIVAPAGSGKTRVLTERLRHLIVDRAIEPESVLAVAYNKKAQEEMEARAGGFRPRVQTLNALGYSLLREARGAGLQVADERDVRRLLDRLAPARRHRANTDALAAYLEALSRVRLGLQVPEDVEGERDDIPDFAELFPRYRAALREAGAVDFDEQIYAAIEALVADGEFRRRAQARCRHLLVDEFQDLTPAHVLLIRLLAAPALDVFGVGDDDQVIYGYAGADPAFLIEFDKLFPGAAHHALEVNYRCPEVVVEAATNLLGRNRRRVPKSIRAAPAAVTARDALDVRIHPAPDGAEAIADVVAGWLDAGTPPDAVAVLTRVNALLLAPHVTLTERGIPISSSLQPEVLERTGVRAALAYVRIGVAPDAIAGSDVAEILRRPSRGLPQWFPDRLRRRRRWDLDGLRDIGSNLSEKDADKVHLLVDDLAVVAEAAAKCPTREVLQVIRDGIGLGRAMAQLDASGGVEGSSHLDDLEALLQVAALHPAPGTFETWLRGAFQHAASTGGVTLSTVHRVKGMEWDYVAVFGASAGIVPHRLAEDVEEERRILHVAITRARRQVVVLAEGTRPSPFLAELSSAAPPLSPLAAEPSRIAPRRPAARVEPDTALEKALREWRLARARADAVPPYVVMHDATLRELAASEAKAPRDLLRVTGMGPTRVERYGAEILAVLAAASA